MTAEGRRDEVEALAVRAGVDRDLLRCVRGGRVLSCTLLDLGILRVALDPSHTGLDFVEDEVQRALVVLVGLGCLGHRQQLEKAADVVVLGGAVVAHERDERHVEHLLGLLPKRVSRAGLGRRRHGDEKSRERLDFEVGPDVVERVVDQGAVGEERVERADLIAVVREHVADIEQEVALGVGDEQVGIHLAHVGLHIVARLACARAADDQHVHVAVVVHREALAAPSATGALREKQRVRRSLRIFILDERREFLGGGPPRRTVLLADSGVLLPIDQAHHGNCPRDADSEEHAEHAGVVRQQTERMGGDEAPHLRRGGREALEHIRIGAGAVDEPVAEVGEGEGGSRRAQKRRHLFRDLH